MTSCELYIKVNDEVKRIELFDDEKISITSSVQDIADVSKAKTEFTQSFTIPASEHNNAIFKHWYENAVDGGFDQRIRYDGFIEINTIPFREGGFSLNNVLFNDNRPESYNITFYGRAKSIKDTFKEDNLGSINLDLNHVFNSSNVIDYIQTVTDNNLAYPLFAHDRFYQYGGGGSTDITINGGSIAFESLFPAVRLGYIFTKITEKYGISFVGAFFESITFAKLWVLYKNAESMYLQNQPLLVNFTSKTGGLDGEINLTTDQIGFVYAPTIANPSSYRRLRIRITPSAGFTTTAYNVQILKNGVIVNTFENQVGTTISLFFNRNLTSEDLNDKYTIRIVTVNVFSFTSTLFYIRGVVAEFSASGTVQTTTTNINIQSYAPQIKVIDLFSGLVKMFNLVILPINENTFEIKPLEMYYNDGRINDISDNVIVDTIDFKKTSMYKNINFSYQDSSNLLNNSFNTRNEVSQRGYKYGDLKYEQIDSLESSTYTVELPFENPLASRLGGNFQTITFKDKDSNNYVPKPVLLYDNGLNSLSPNVRIKTESGHASISNYRRFSNDISNVDLISLNWGEEVSSFFIQTIEQGLFKRYYANYLGNIFNIKGRLVIVKCKFNPVELSQIQLNDRIVIRDKKYTINKLVVELTSGEATLELLTDFRPTILTVTNPDIIILDADSSDVEIFLSTAGRSEIDMKSSADAWIVYDDTIVSNSDFNLNVFIDKNNSGVQRTGYIIGEWDNEVIQIPIIQDA